LIPSRKEAAMQYRSIVMEMIQSNHDLHERLKAKRLALTAINVYGKKLRSRHLELAETMDRGQAFELALSEIEQSLLPAPDELTALIHAE
jgi:hypothetical protein